MKKIVCVVVMMLLLLTLCVEAGASKTWEEKSSYNFEYKVPQGFELVATHVQDGQVIRSFGNVAENMEMHEYTYYLNQKTEEDLMEVLMFAAALSVFEEPDNTRTEAYEKDGIWYGIGYGRIDEREAAHLIAIAGQDMLSLVFAREKEFETEMLRDIAETIEHTQKTTMEEHIKKTETEKKVEFDFRKMSRNPEKYVGKETEISGEVIQVVGTRKEGYILRVAVDGDQDEVVMVIVEKETMPDYSILKNDDIRILATLAGEYAYETVRGDEVTTLLMYAQEVEVKF